MSHASRCQERSSVRCQEPRQSVSREDPRVAGEGIDRAQQVARDSVQIAAEARTAVAEAVASGKLTKLTLLLRPDEQAILDALDHYASEHGLKSRNQVLRAALARLLNVEIDQPHWGWPAGKPRS